VGKGGRGRKEREGGKLRKGREEKQGKKRAVPQTKMFAAALPCPTWRDIRKRPVKV